MLRYCHKRVDLYPLEGKPNRGANKMKTIKSARTTSGDTVELVRDSEGLHVSYKVYLTPCDLVNGRIMLCDGMYGLEEEKVTEILTTLEGVK